MAAYQKGSVFLFGNGVPVKVFGDSSPGFPPDYEGYVLKFFLFPFFSPGPLGEIGNRTGAYETGLLNCLNPGNAKAAERAP